MAVLKRRTKREKPTEPAAAGDPGYSLGIAGFVVSFFSGIVGLILSAVALNLSKKAERSNVLAFAGLVIGIVKTALAVIAVIGIVIFAITYHNYCANNAAECNDSPSQSSEPTNGGSDTIDPVPLKTY